MPTSSTTNNTMQRLTPFLMFFVFLAVFGVLAWYLLWPAFAQFLPGGSLDYDTQQSVLLKKTSDLASREKFNALYDSSNNGQAKVLDGILPKGKNTALLFAMHEVLAKKQGLTLSAIDVVSPDAAGTNTGTNELSVSLKLAGATYGNFKQYIKNLENLLRITEVDSMGFDSHTGTVNLNLHTFYQGSGQ